MAKSVPAPINLVNVRKRPHFLRMPLTPHVPPQQLDAVYTGQDKMTIANLFVLHVKSSAGAWITSETEQDISLQFVVLCPV